MQKIGVRKVTFTRRVPPELLAASTLCEYAGTYRTPTGGSFEVVLKEDGTLGISLPGQPFQELIPWRARRFKVKEFSDVTFEFVVDKGKVVALQQTNPSGVYKFVRK